MKVHAIEACPGCGGERFETFDAGGGHQLCRCSRCETVSAREYGDPAEVYSDGYLRGESDFGLDVRAPEFQDYLFRVADERMKRIETVSGGPGSLLDVGCGSGEVLQRARDRGWEVQGVEPERSGAEMARERGVDVKVSTLEDSGLPEHTYDVVSAFHVLEHLPDSQAFLRTLSRWVRPGGHLVIEVPNFASRQRRILGADWPYLRPLEHLVHFTPETLARTIRAAGLTPVVTRSPVYVGPPQNLDFALGDLARSGRLKSLMKPLSSVRTVNGDQARFPSRLGWAVLRAVEAIHDRAGVGTVVFCVARAR